jgi:hypothetical protein
MRELLDKAGLTPEILKDPAKRARAIDEYNAKAGGLRGLMRDGKLELAETHDIPSGISLADSGRYLRFAAAGKRVPIIFAAGRATRMKLPKAFDALGLAGLTPNILSELNSLREGDEASPRKVESSERLKALLVAGRNGEVKSLDDLSLIQRQLLRLHSQTEELFKQNPGTENSIKDWLENTKFAVVANEENKSAIALQLASIRFAGLKPEHVYVVVQPEEGGLEVLPDGQTRPYDKEVWPEGHGKPFIDMNADPKAAFCLNARGHLIGLRKTFNEELQSRGVERAVFAQVNDLHLLEDMTHVERWFAADELIQNGADMVMEMVENALKQNGGGIFKGKNASVVMRDTICMKTRDLEAYSVPRSLSRMFYELTVQGMSKLTPQTLPAYLNERKTSDNKTVLTREYYSGDASSSLNGQAIQRKGYELDTFKMQSRIPSALSKLSKFNPSKITS